MRSERATGEARHGGLLAVHGTSSATKSVVLTLGLDGWQADASRADRLTSIVSE